MTTHHSALVRECSTTAAEPSRSSLARWVVRRWPTAVAVGLSVGSFSTEATAQTTHGLAGALTLLPLLYVIVTLLRRRAASWPTLIALLALFVGIELQDAVEPVAVVLAIALAAAVWGRAHGRHREGEFRLQLAGMAAFGAVALVALVVDAELARYLVAAGWIAHGVWDFVHLAKDRVVARSYAEWCGVVDVLTGIGLLVAPFL